MQKIAIFGGTFNPIHNGHLHLAHCFSQKINFDRVIFVPTKTPIHKEDIFLASAEDRLYMCKLAVQGTNYEVSNMEVCRQTPSYTVLTLEDLKRQFPYDNLYFITGEDMFLSLLTWKNPARIFELATICSAPRSGEGMERMSRYAKKLKELGAVTILENIDFLPISSTMVRTAQKNGKDISNMVPTTVMEYIEQHHLYKR